MKFSQRNPCAECPFRRFSPPGWLGPHGGKAETLINSILGLVPTGNQFIGCEPANFPCHMDVTKIIAGIEAGGEACYGEVPDEYQDRLEHCVGALLMLKARCKRPHDRIKSLAMDLARASEPMILNREEFIAHHTLRAKSKRKQP